METFREDVSLGRWPAAAHAVPQRRQQEVEGSTAFCLGAVGSGLCLGLEELVSGCGQSLIDLHDGLPTLRTATPHGQQGCDQHALRVLGVTLQAAS